MRRDYQPKGHIIEEMDMSMDGWYCDSINDLSALVGSLGDMASPNCRKIW
jgi:hypothetical protein